MASINPEEAAEVVRRFNDTVGRSAPIGRTLAKDTRDAAIGLKDFSNTLNSGFKDITKAVGNLSVSLMEGAEGMSAYNDVASSLTNAFADLLGWVPIVGPALEEAAKAVGAYAVAVNKQGDALFKTYQDMSKSGLVSGMKDTFENLKTGKYLAAEIADYSE
jgi:hypothetical protein